MKAIYEAQATVTGGRDEGHGETSDGELVVELRYPGTPGGTNPEQLFAVGYASCFESSVKVVARRAKLEAGDVSIDSTVSLYPTPERGFKLGVRLDVSLPSVQDPAQALKLVEQAHAVCPYSHATRGNIEVVLTANGEPVSGT